MGTSVQAIVYTNGTISGPSAEGAATNGSNSLWFILEDQGVGSTFCHELGHCVSYAPSPGEEHRTHQPRTHCNLPNHVMNTNSGPEPEDDRNFCNAIDGIVGRQ